MSHPKRYSWIVCAALALGFAAVVAPVGLPALRHDWFVFASRHDFFPASWDSFAGWVSPGIGAPRPYPTDYIFIALNSLAMFVVGARLDILLIMFSVGVVTARAGWALAECAGGDFAVCTAGAVFALFNPWAYSKVVAGHVFMILACSAFGLIAVEMLRARRSAPSRLIDLRISLLVLLTLAQIQFFIVAFAAVAAWCLATRRLLPVVTGIVAFLPIAVGMALNTSALLSIPYKLAWQVDQSVRPASAIILQGYYARYADALGAPSVVALWIVFALAVCGAIAAFRSAWVRAAIAAAIASVLLATGTKGPTGAVYVFLVRHVVLSGVFRELYDVLGYTALAYVVLVAAAAVRFSFLRPVWVLAALTCAVSWALAPPARFWVPLGAIPHVRIAAPPHSRFALYPAFQPLTYDGAGSGLDPDAFARSAGVTPVNTSLPTYPEDAALAEYERTGDAGALRALSVSTVVDRPWLHTDVNSLSAQTLSKWPKGRSLRSRSLAPFRPELTLEPVPQVTSFVRDLNCDCVFFGDAAGLAGRGVPPSWAGLERAHAVHGTPSTLSPNSGWADASTFFALQPKLAQQFGGAFTRNPRSRMRVRGGQALLALIHGRLLTNQGRTLSRTTSRYVWLGVPSGVSYVTCEGECAIAARAAYVPRFRERQQTSTREGLRFRQPAPWLALTELPPTGNRVLRYNVRFDRHWLAFRGDRVLPHFRIAGAFNGWIVGASGKASRVVLVEWVAVVQFALELAGLLCGAALLAAFALAWAGVRRANSNVEIAA